MTRGTTRHSQDAAYKPLQYIYDIGSLAGEVRRQIRGDPVHKGGAAMESLFTTVVVIFIFLLSVGLTLAGFINTSKI